MCVSYDSACLFARTFSFSLIQKCTATAIFITARKAKCEKYYYCRYAVDPVVFTALSLKSNRTCLVLMSSRVILFD